MFEKIKDWWYAYQRKKQLAKAPTTLDDAVQHLMDHSSEYTKRAFAEESEDHPGSSLHFLGGLAMRNGWGLWVKEQPLTQWFRARGIWHADDMSAIIYKAFWCKLTNTPFDITKEAEYYKKFWSESAGVGFDGVELVDATNKSKRAFTIKIKPPQTKKWATKKKKKSRD